MLKLSPVGWVALVLLVVGGLNWGLVGALNLDLVTTIFGEAKAGEASIGDMSVEGPSTGEPSSLSRIIYVVVGLSAIYILVIAVMGCTGKQAGAGASAGGQAESTGQGEGSTS